MITILTTVSAEMGHAKIVLKIFEVSISGRGVDSVTPLNTALVRVRVSYQ